MQPEDRVGRFAGPGFRLPAHNIQAHQRACTRQ